MLLALPLTSSQALIEGLMLFFVRAFDYCGAYIGHKSGAFFRHRTAYTTEIIIFYI
jgi:putative Mn2+ efflux pump MntP